MLQRKAMPKKLISPTFFMNHTLRGFFLHGLLFTLLLSQCSRHPTLTVRNDSPGELRNIVARGTGFSQPLGNLAAGQQRKIEIMPTGDSGLQLEFEANGHHYTPPKDGYLEASNYYHVQATVRPDFTVKVETLH
jgi:hypothetical protein